MQTPAPLIVVSIYSPANSGLTGLAIYILCPNFYSAGAMQGYNSHLPDSVELSFSAW